jgi:hypothetical protein
MRRWPPVPRGAETYSVSSLRDWACPYRGKRRRLDKVAEPLSEELHEGRILHDIAASYVRHCCESGVDTDLSVVPHLARTAFWDAEEPHPLSPEHAAEIEAVARRWAGSYVVDRHHTRHVEEMWLLPLPGDPLGTAHLYVALDHLLIDGRRAVVRDLKSDYRLRPEAEVRSDLQLQVYAWAVLQRYPEVEEVWCELDFLRHRTVCSVQLDAEAVRVQVGQVLLDAIGRIRTLCHEGRFPALAGAHCTYCGFRRECPLLQKLSDPGTVGDGAEARALAARLTAAEAWVRGAREALREWTAHHGPVGVDGVVWGHHTRERRTIEDVEAFLRAMRAAGQLDRGWRAVRVDGRSLPGLLADPSLRAALEPLIVETTGSEFGPRRGGEAE